METQSNKMEKQAETIVFERFIQFVNKNPDKNWDIKSISHNRNLTFEMIEKYSNINWNWQYLTYNPNLTLEILEKYVMNHGIGKSVLTKYDVRNN